MTGVMKYTITENQYNLLQKHIQNLIDNELGVIRDESLEWGLGEMDELDEIDSIDKITIDRLQGFDVYVNIYSQTKRQEFDNIISSIEYGVSEWIPNIKIIINDIFYK